MTKYFKAYQKLVGADKFFGRSPMHAQFVGQDAADIIKSRILEGKPLMITRFGANELNIILNYLFINKSLLGNIGNLIMGIPYFNGFKKGAIDNFYNVAGFFPADEGNIVRFCELSLKDLVEIDVLGSWLNHEKFVFPMMKPDHVRVRLRDLTPATNPTKPWTFALAGKKVLVVHPFEETIKMQYAKRRLLFSNYEMLPDFELKTMKAVQSVAGNGFASSFKNWFEALDYMKGKIETFDFDVAILGCGAYGMPLAAHIKRMGKIAFHLGGETQIMFGIKGKRWEDSSYAYDKHFYNEHWIRPLLIDTPQNVQKVEGGCYW